MPGRGKEEDLTLGQAALLEVSGALERQIALGLESEGQQVQCLPTWVPCRSVGVSGRALVVDLGGTSVRAAVVSVSSKGAVVEQGPVSAALPVRRGQPLALDTFLEVQVSLVKALGPPQGLPLGYCFSYPAQSTRDGDARLLRWTKELWVPDVEGRLVGRMLAQALERGGVRCGPVLVLNDTVASLMASLVHQNMDGHIGLIVGTGTNMAVGLPVSAAAKLGDANNAALVPFNLESGNFHPPGLTDADDALDLASADVGRQRFEKAVSGVYLGRLMMALNPNCGLGPDEGAAGVVRLAQDGDALARAVLNRSADLVAAGLVGTARVLKAVSSQPVEHIGVMAEGSVFWKAPGYAQRVEQTLADLSPVRISVLKMASANLIGAAMGALGAD